MVDVEDAFVVVGADDDRGLRAVCRAAKFEVSTRVSIVYCGPWDV